MSPHGCAFTLLPAAARRPRFRVAGDVESNSLMRWSLQHPVALVSMKASATAATVYVAEKIRKKHPKRLPFMTAINAAYALLVVHNYRVPVN